MLTLTDLIEKLKREDEVTILELLDIHSHEIVERFTDFIEERYDELAELYEKEDEDYDPYEFECGDEGGDET